MNLVNIDSHQSVVNHHPNLVQIFLYLKDMDDVDPFNISGVDRGKESETGKLGINITTVITYKTPFVVNGQLVTVYLALGEGVACNTTFSWPFMKTIKTLITTKNNALVSGIMGYQFKLDMMVPQRPKDQPKAPEGIPVSLSFAIPETQNITDNGYIMHSTL